MAVVLQDIYDRFPDFDLTDSSAPGPNTTQDALVTKMLAGAERQLDRTLFPTTVAADECILYLTAHLLARSMSSVNARLQKSRGDDRLVTGEDIFYETYMKLARAASSGYRNT